MESWVFKAVNPFMKSLLRSPLHGWMSGSVTILGFRGRKSGREFATPLSYVREGGTVFLLSAKTTSCIGRISPGFARRESIESVGVARVCSRASGAGPGPASCRD